MKGDGMSITLEQVKVWGIQNGIGHIVMSGEKHDDEPSGLAWVRTPHGMYSWMEIQSERPKRICRECRSAMGTITPNQDAHDAARKEAGL